MHRLEQKLQFALPLGRKHPALPTLQEARRKLSGQTNPLNRLLYGELVGVNVVGEDCGLAVGKRVNPKLVGVEVVGLAVGTRVGRLVGKEVGFLVGWVHQGQIPLHPRRRTMEVNTIKLVSQPKKQRPIHHFLLSERTLLDLPHQASERTHQPVLYAQPLRS